VDSGLDAVDAPAIQLDSALDAGGFVFDGLPGDGFPRDRALDIPISGSGGSAFDGAREGAYDSPIGGGTGGNGGGKGGAGGGSAGTGGTSVGTGGTPTGTGGAPAGTGGIATGGSGSVDAGPPDGGSSQGLVAYYSCEKSTGTSLPDLSGNKHDAILVTGTGGTTGYKFATGKVGNALDLIVAQQGYATLPADLLKGATQATIATWVYLNNNTTWQRIFDFGKDTTSYMFLTSNGGNNSLPRFAISVGGRASEETMEGSEALPTGKWKHIAVVLGPSSGILYVDGVQVGVNTSMTLRPADLGSLPNCYIGRSQYASDPYFDGDIDEFRVYNRALSPSEIQALASGS
jgi:hypothetical protein